MGLCNYTVLSLNKLREICKRKEHVGNNYHLDCRLLFSCVSLSNLKEKKSWKDRKIIRCLNIISRKLSFHDSIRLHKIRFPHPTFTNFASFSIIISPPPFRFSFLKNSTNSVLDILSTKTHRESERFESWGGGYENGDERTTARNGCKLAAKAFSREARRGGRDDYGQLRYTHSVSPYRSIATGGSHFLANGCFHPPANAPSFPLTLSFHHRSFPFFLPPPSPDNRFSSLPWNFYPLLSFLINLWNFASRPRKTEKNGDSRGIISKASCFRKDREGDGVRNGVAYFEQSMGVVIHHFVSKIVRKHYKTTPWSLFIRWYFLQLLIGIR